MHLLALPFLLCATFNGVHVPHDDVHGIATADLSSGVRETVITTQRVCKVFRSRDGGISWEAVHGDGLELAMADSVIWDSHPNGQRFLIGTNKGVWAYDPISEVVSALSSGLGNGDGNFIACMDAPENGSDGPILLVNREGDIFTLNRATDTWEMQLQTGNTDVRAQVSVSPHFFLSGSNGPEQSVAAAVAGVLYLSEDGGENWMTHPQFSTPAVVPGDRLITAIAYSDDYITSGDLILATSVENLSNFTGDEGTMWRSGDFGGTFSNVLRTDSSIRSLQQTPPGPSGNSWFLAAVFAYPDFYDLPSSDGILRSSDGGMTWDDFGSAQDFIAEGDASDTVTLGRQYILDFEVSPTFSTDGEIFFGRSEGLFKSRDEGLHWIPIAYRPVLHTRGMSSYVDKRGDLWAALATYGSGTLIHNVTTRTVGVWGGGSPMDYQGEVVLSPRFDLDGVVLVGGAKGSAFWFDPNLKASNPFGTWGWKIPKGIHLLGYTRSIAFSPHFDGRGTPGSDQTIFVSTSTSQASTFRTTDGGLTGERLDKMEDGSSTTWFKNLVVAPTYDASTSQGRTDVYGTKGGKIVRLHDNRWRLIAELPCSIESLALPPNFDRVPMTDGRPLLFVGMANFPYFGVIEDQGGNPTATFYPDGLELSDVIKIACPPDFATRPVIYAATYIGGIKKLDLSQPSPVWENVGGPFPSRFVGGMALSPDFENDRVILVGSQNGLIVGKDVPGSPWSVRESKYSRDNMAPAFRFYQPNHPANSQPDRPWRWDTYLTYNLWEKTALEFRDYDVSYVEVDGSYVEFTDSAKALQIHTFLSPNSGTAVVTIENALTGVLVDSQTVDLNNTSWQNRSLTFKFPRQPVKVRMEAQLDPGELLFLDGVSFIPF